MQIDVARLDRTSDLFIDAAADPTLWKGLIEDIAVATGSFGIDILPLSGRLYEDVVVTDSLAPALQAYFEEEWYKRDFRARQIPVLTARGIMLEQDYASEDHFAGLEYYRAQAKYDLRWTAILGFSSGADLVAFVLQRTITDGPFERAEAAILRKLQQKLMLAASVMKSLADTRTGGMADAFHAANVGCIFFDRLGRVAVVNDKARQFLGPDLQIVHGRLATRRSAETARLNSRLGNILSGEVSFTMQSPDVVLVTRQGKRPLIVRMQRLLGNIQDSFGQSAAMALIEDPDEKYPASTSSLSTLYGLTAREAEIAVLLASGHGPADAGNHLGITYETVRTHMRTIFRKTDTSKQTQLSALVGSLRV